MTPLRIGITFNLRPTQRAASADKQTVPGRLDLPLDDDDEEFDSFETVSAQAAVLEGLGHQVELLGQSEALLDRLLKGPRPDLVWNIAEGQGRHRSREAQVPAVLEMLGIPYTGSDPLTLATTLDKDCAKRLVAAHGVQTPHWIIYRGDWPSQRHELAALSFPVFVKPACEGSSKGILTSSVIEHSDELQQVLTQLVEVYRQPVLVEEYIEGDELTVGLVGNDPAEILGVMRVLPSDAVAARFVYSLEVKRDWRRQARYECPAPLSGSDTATVERAALACFAALGCRDVARIDFRLRDGVAYFLEANPLPGLSPESGDLVILSRLVGVEHRELIARILQAAMERHALSNGQAVAAQT